MGRLDGKVAIITGGAGGQGAVHAQVFVDEGAKVVISDINEEAGNEVADELGDNVYFIKHDVTNEEDWKNVVAGTEDKFGPVNILVNNAGMVIMKTIQDMTLDDFDTTVKINQYSTFLGLKHIFSSMKKTKNGSIINISSTGGLIGEPGIGYVSAKFAVRGMAKTAAKEYAEYGIRVNSVHPGPVETPFLTDSEEASAFASEAIESIPLKRMAQSDEVSDLLVYLASDESRYATGAEFVLDGGITA
jgi:3alpha(or 20beta)-hydroxysteroid dehydrogenase